MHKGWSQCRLFVWCAASAYSVHRSFKPLNKLSAAGWVSAPHNRGDPSIERTPKGLRLLAAAHVERRRRVQRCTRQRDRQGPGMRRRWPTERTVAIPFSST